MRSLSFVCCSCLFSFLWPLWGRFCHVNRVFAQLLASHQLPSFYDDFGLLLRTRFISSKSLLNLDKTLRHSKNSASEKQTSVDEKWTRLDSCAKCLTSTTCVISSRIRRLAGANRAQCQRFFTIGSPHRAICQQSVTLLRPLWSGRRFSPLHGSGSIQGVSSWRKNVTCGVCPGEIHSHCKDDDCYNCVTDPFGIAGPIAFLH
jgi:hypothetical protein